MPFAVGLSQGVLANLLALQTTTSQINTVQNQLATGKKVNTALDNPSSFFLASSFGFAATDVITISDGTANTTTITANATQTVQSLINAINASATNKDRAEL